MALPPEEGQVDTSYPPLKSRNVEKAPMPGITEWRGAWREKAWGQRAMRSCGSIAALLFRPVRAGETPPCLHTTSRCLARNLGGVEGGTHPKKNPHPKLAEGHSKLNKRPFVGPTQTPPLWY